ncbi:MAG: hypothetical protein ACD_15C00028G0005 [uncultured bacterium]|nr:MAG: hypothetical protein ACD_15C00028G0005 [uncultured bacterium]HCU70832.1 hypothetical protein [Candidatus Moranbacteria bacterium]
MFRKIKLAYLFAIMAFFGWLSLPLETKAATDTCTPVIKVQKTKETSVKLKVTCSNLAKAKVNLKILVNNEDTDSDSYKKVTANLGKKGSVKIKINNIDSATSYNFKVKIKKSSEKKYSAYSSEASTTTKGSDYEPEIEKINNITENSVKLNISSEDLENEAVNVQAAYKKKTSWSTKTFSLTLDGDGEGSVTLDGLKSETLYNFKIRIKKDDDKSYSPYSSAKTATTDED